MSKTLALRLILVIAILGVSFSGYLSYQELFAGGCQNALVSCGTNTGPILGLPACVYGLVMYLLVALIAGFSLARK